MMLKRLFQTALLSLCAIEASAIAIGGQRFTVKADKRAALQDLVTWDEHSLFVRGERILIYSGEFHPFRLPVPSLWLDVFQKIKSLGYNGVSFYTDWALHEGKHGDFTAEGIFGYDEFFKAAETAGIYLIARPGPYINAEVSGGGFPGWLQRNPGRLRTRDPAYLNATDNYVNHITQIIAKAQITNGGPVILLQVENEYTQGASDDPEFPDPVYFKYVEDQYLNNGIVVPLINNDASPQGNFAPGPPAKESAVDIYGHDGYPLGFDCSNPYTWPSGYIPTSYGYLHEQQSSSTPYSIIEFQGGSFDPWAGSGFAKCTELIGSEFERVFYKNDFSFGVKIFNLYMTYGGTNWGNLGHPGGYTSYDYAAVISENRNVTKEKYSQAKLLANFLQASPAYLTAVYQDNSQATGAYTGNSDLFTTAVVSNVTKFFVIRHTAYESLDTTTYKITLPTSQGNISIPQLNGSLSLHGRDSKMFVTDYDVGGINLLYSTAEIFTWKKYGNQRVLVLYTGPGETNEFAVTNAGKASVFVGPGITIDTKNNATIVSFSTVPSRRVVSFSGGLTVHIEDRQGAYNYWVIDAPNDATTGNYTSAAHSQSALIVKGGYLMRSAVASGSTVNLIGDLNATSKVKIIGGAPSKLKTLTFNGQSLNFTQAPDGVVKAAATYTKPEVTIPDLSTITWKKIDSLPEIQNDYDDGLWTSASLVHTYNSDYNNTTPTSLFSSDYGYHTGYLLYRGAFVANGNESSFTVHTVGGSAYGHSVWLNNTYLGSFNGDNIPEDYSSTYNLSKLTSGSTYVFTVLIDNMGLDENYQAGDSGMKTPRGIYDYSLSGHAASDVTWKLTGNLGGEEYRDRTRGPLNEGGLYVERQGFHLPGAPIDSWSNSAGPTEGLSSAGVTFYAADIDLDLPTGYDIPLSLTIDDATSSDYRLQLYVNGYQFGKYVNNVGPQHVYPVPEGIWDYHGTNRVAVSLWSQEAGGAKVGKLSLTVDAVVLSGFGPVAMAPLTAWTKREGAY